MSQPDLTPYWTDDEWTGFLIQLVPAPHLSVSVRELYRQVRARIETDAVLYDLVTLTATANTGGRDTDDERILWELLVASMAPGHFFAPRGVFAVIVVAEREADIGPLCDRLAESRLLSRLRVRFCPLVVRVDPRTLGLAPSAVMAITDLARTLMTEYEQQPDIAVDEAEFLTELRRLVDEGYALPGQQTGTGAPAASRASTGEPMPAIGIAPVYDASPLKSTASEATTPSAGTPRAWNTPPARIPELLPQTPDTSRGTSPMPRPEQPSALPAPAPAAEEPAPARPAPRPAVPAPALPALPAPAPPALPAPAPPALKAPALPAPPPSTQQPSLRDAVVHSGADMVFVQERSAWQRLRAPTPTDAGSIEQLAGQTDAVSLAYLVFIPDDRNQSRELTKRRLATALELDKVLEAVVADAETRRPLKVSVEVLSATSPLRKHGAIVPAGHLTGGDLPKIPIEMFDLFEVADSLIEVMARSTRSLAARDVRVLSRHLIFLATVPLRDTNTTGPEWDRLLKHARITWVHFGPAKPSFTELDRPSPFGVHVLTDKDDVPGLFRRESGVLYGWPAPTAPVAKADPTTEPAEDPPPTAGGRRWLHRRKSKPPES